MLIQPPIDKLIDKVGSKYALVCLVTKRARQLYDKRLNLIEDTDVKAVTYASEEIYNGKVLWTEE
ncbi:MAG: DNA-directed RNA polymerase subunit omega [Clostridiales bacterium]|jgi:DNA-directed RNA polymerase subunit omega|nr:DNA-directed RNA polymerase subunit omega [Clostridiales bacterium]